MQNILSIPEKIDILADKFSDGTAIIASDRSLTFKELNELSNIVAYGILSLCPELKEGDSIVLLLDRKSYVYPLEIGIVRAGFSFIPMTPGYPEDRVSFSMENADSRVLITTKEILKEKEELKALGHRILLVEEIFSCQGEPLPLPEIRQDRLAHIFYTSGSTGVPKGVRHTVFSDSLITTRFDSDFPFFEALTSGTVMSITHIAFILSQVDYVALCNGCSLVATPSFISNFLTINNSKPALAGLDSLILAGEKPDPAVFELIFRLNPKIHIINAYGMTEGFAIFSKLITNEDRGLNMGQPAPYTNFLIMDKEGNYSTRGRNDDMVKFQGKRVELGEIESVLMELHGIVSCKVLMKSGVSNDFLAAFYTADKEIKNRDILDHLRIKLLHYMLPGAFVKLDHMPLNRNRKIDRGKLLEMDITFDGSDYEEPEKELEKKLCEWFASVLGSKKFSVSGSFFDHGGTSLSVSRLISLMSEDGYKVSYGDVFQNPTPRDLAFFLEDTETKFFVQTMDREEYPLTKTQL